jgi:HK97 gp10 family phage protein
MKATVKVEGLRDLEAAMMELTKSAARGVARRTLTEATKPLVADMQSRAPTKGIVASIGVGPKISRRNMRQQAAFLGKFNGVELFVGPSRALDKDARLAHLFEFGTRDRVQKKTGRATGRMTPRPFIRPAWDANADRALEIIKTQTWQEIQKATERAQRKAARAALKVV